MTVAQIRNTYLADGLVRTIYFHFPILAQESAFAAEYVECAGEQGTEHFWGFIDAVYENQGRMSVEVLSEIASEMELDDARMNECLNSGRHHATWQIDYARGSAMGVESTPTIFLVYLDKDGEEVRLKFQGARDFDNMAQILDAILREIEYPQY